MEPLGSLSSYSQSRRSGEVARGANGASVSVGRKKPKQEPGLRVAETTARRHEQRRRSWPAGRQKLISQLGKSNSASKSPEHRVEYVLAAKVISFFFFFSG